MKVSKVIGVGLVGGALLLGYKLYKMGEETSNIGASGLTSEQTRYSKTISMLMGKPFSLNTTQKVEKIGPSGMNAKTAAAWKKLVVDRHPASVSLVKGIR